MLMPVDQDPTPREFQALTRGVLLRRDPELTLLLILLKARLGPEPNLRRQQLYNNSKLTLSEFKRALAWLRQEKLVGSLQSRGEIFLYALW